jgi:hypothetical protein
MTVVNDTTSLSNCNTVMGPFVKFPVPLDRVT